MSQWTSRSQQTARIHSHQYSGRARVPRPIECAPRNAKSHERVSSVSPQGAAYTLAHAGKQVRFGPVAFWIAVGTVVIMAVWSITSATYLAFRDDVLRTLITRQAEQQFAYEDRIAELARPDRPHDQSPTARSGTIRTETRRVDPPPVPARIARYCLERRRRPCNHRLDQARGKAKRRAGGGFTARRPRPAVEHRRRAWAPRSRARSDGIPAGAGSGPDARSLRKQGACDPQRAGPASGLRRRPQRRQAAVRSCR